MKKALQLIIIFAIGIITFPSCSSNTDEQYRLDRNKVKDLPWYNSFISSLRSENKIDSLDAIIYKRFSSDLYFSAIASPDSIVKKFGKLNDADIISLYSITENNTISIYAVSQSYPFCHLYKYDPANNKLEKIKNKTTIICSGAEDLVLTENNDSTMTFWAKRKNELENKQGTTKYFLYDKQQNTFCHYRNCKMNGDQEDCTPINH